MMHQNHHTRVFGFTFFFMFSFHLLLTASTSKFQRMPTPCQELRAFVISSTAALVTAMSGTWRIAIVACTLLLHTEPKEVNAMSEHHCFFLFNIVSCWNICGPQGLVMSGDFPCIYTIQCRFVGTITGNLLSLPR